jgi:hypothetical protein
MSLRYLLRRPVWLAIGEPARHFEGLPLRVRDLADLEAVAASLWPNPADELADGLDADTLRSLADRAEDGWPASGSLTFHDVASNMLVGRATVLVGVLRTQGIDMEQAAAIAETATPEQWRRVERVAWGVDPMSEVIAAIDRYLGVTKSAGEGCSFAEAICALATSLRRLPIELADVTLPELIYIGEKGKRSETMIWGAAFDPIADAARDRFYRETGGDVVTHSVDRN